MVHTPLRYLMCARNPVRLPLRRLLPKTFLMKRISDARLSFMYL